MFLFSCSQNCLHFCTRIIALTCGLTCGSRVQGCAARMKSSSPCHPCLHLHMSVPHSHLLPRCLHQEQPLRSRCRSRNTALHRQEEESGSLAETTSSTGYEPNVIDNFDYAETTEIFLQEQSSDTMPSFLHDAELGDETIGKALSSPLFIQEGE